MALSFITDLKVAPAKERWGSQGTPSGIVLIIAYGNSLRGDDGAGLILGKMLEGACLKHRIAAKRLSCHQLLPELVEEISNPAVRAVVFVDTRIAAEVHTRVMVQSIPLSTCDGSTISSHHLHPSILLAFAHILSDCEVPAWHLTVPGFVFEHGENLSTAVGHALDTAGPVLDHLVNALFLTQKTE